MNGYIYKITNKINQKIYIGKTLSSIEERFKEHQKESKKNRSEKRPLYDAMNKYGIENFSIELVEEVPIENLSDREIYWIDFYQSYHNGYNATCGGEGKQLYDYNAIVKAYLSGKLVKELAQEFECSKDTISQALKLANVDSKINGKKNLRKSVIAIDKNNNIINSFTSYTDAAKWLYNNQYTTCTDWDNIAANIGRVVSGKRKTAYGLIWKSQTEFDKDKIL